MRIYTHHGLTLCRILVWKPPSKFSSVGQHSSVNTHSMFGTAEEGFTLIDRTNRLPLVNNFLKTASVHHSHD